MSIVVPVLWGGLAALAAPALSLSVDPSSSVDAYSREAVAEGRLGLAAVAACRPLAPDLALCLRRRGPDGGRHLVTLEDLAGWSLDESAAFAEARAHAAEVWKLAPPTPQAVEGLEGRYWLRSEADGIDCLGLLFPEELARIAGATPVVACPDVAALMFWVPPEGGPGDFDKAVGVGVRRLAEASSQAGSPLLYRHNGEKWLVWAEVKGTLRPLPAAPGSGPAPGPR